MTSKLNERRRSSGGKGLGAFVAGAIRRVSLTRRGSQEANELPLAQPQQVAKRPSMDSIPASIKSPSMVSSESRASSLVAPVQLLNSSSPASELPKTWAEWNYAYQNGFIDFNDPPPPPTDLGASDHATLTGQFRAPFPANEAKRQRAVDNVGSFLFNHTTMERAAKRRGSLQDPRDKGGNEDAPPLAAPVPPPPGYEKDKVLPAYPAGTVPAPSPVDVEMAPAELPVTKRQEAPIHPALEKLAQQAKEKFGVDATTVSLMDRDQQVFMADSECTFLKDTDSIPRELTCCSHAMLKASTGTKDPLVVLDFEKDWRFNKNGFGDYKSGFYAAAPIMLPAPLGDDAGQYPAGIFCLLGEKPRTSFSEEDRLSLQDIADQASVEIQRYAAQHRQARKQELSNKRKQWKKSKLVRRVSGHPTLDTVTEMDTPPMTPDMSGLDLGEFEDAEQEELFNEAPRRPSLADSIASDSTVSDMNTTSIPPAFSSRRAGTRQGVSALRATDIPNEVSSVLDLSTQLVAESIEMDFAYLIAVDLAAAKSSSPSSKSPLRLVSVYGLPVPPPLFSVDLHVQTLTSTERNTLLFTNEQFDGAEGEYSTGLLVKINQVGDTGYLLGSFSEDGRRVLNTEDLLFLKSFARDLSKHTAEL
ncbi:hypothetical protein JCM8547_009391 [Rhodosporidiobolus lusitaniae]